ncbi:MAG: thermonuclease family protein [Hyphomicrobiaceae bacterium]
MRLIAGLILLVLLAILGRLQPGLFEREGKGPTLTPGTEISGIARVIDGDSLVIDGREIRLKNIDAPEGRQICQRDGRDWSCGEAAARELRALVGNRTVRCRSVEIDKHDRALALCVAGTTDVNRAMVERGFAVSFGGYRSEERAAQHERRGLWSGQFQMPQEWRHERGIGK